MVSARAGFSRNGSIPVLTVGRDVDPWLHGLVSSVQQRCGGAGCPVLMSAFVVDGQDLVNSADAAIEQIGLQRLDGVVIEDELLVRPSTGTAARHTGGSLPDDKIQ